MKPNTQRPTKIGARHLVRRTIYRKYVIAKQKRLWAFVYLKQQRQSEKMKQIPNNDKP